MNRPAPSGKLLGLAFLLGATALLAPVAPAFANPPNPTYWYLGDSHVHTTWSDGSENMHTMVQRAKTNGLEWVGFADHTNLIAAKSGGWQAYVAGTEHVQAEYGIPVLPNVEITAREPGFGDAIAFRLNRSKTTIPENKVYTNHMLLHEIMLHNLQDKSKLEWSYSYAGIAHPSGPAWPDWSSDTVHDMRAFELLSGQRLAANQTINRWLWILDTQLSNTLVDGDFTVGIGNSDTHGAASAPPGDYGGTWIRTEAGLNQGEIWTKIKDGRCSAAALGDFGCVTLDGHHQGSIVPKNGTTGLSFRFTYHAAEGRRLQKIELYNRDSERRDSLGRPTSDSPTVYWDTDTLNDHEGTYSKVLACPSRHQFYVVKFLFERASDASVHSHVWTNPIFVKRT